MKAKRTAKLATKNATANQAASPQLEPACSAPRPDPFATEVWLSSLSHTPDPFAPGPSASDPFSHLRDLNHAANPFGPPDPLSASGSLGMAWHGFLRGPLNPFLAAAGLVDSGNLPQWAVRAAFECLDTVKGKEGWNRQYLLGWCIGFGGEGVGLLTKWDVRLLDYAKPSAELKYHLFHRAADEAAQDIPKAIDLLTGCRDGQTEGQHRTKHRNSTFDRSLYVAMNWAKLFGLSRSGIHAELCKLRLMDDDQRRQNLEWLKGIGVPVGKGGRPRRAASSVP